MSFEAPGLDGLLGGLAQQALGAPQPSGAPPSNSPPSHSGPPAGALAAAPAAAAASGGSALSEAYSFSCPSGASYSIPVSYRNASCGAAMKNFARVYSCTLIGDFPSAGPQFHQADRNHGTGAGREREG